MLRRVYQLAIAVKPSLQQQCFVVLHSPKKTNIRRDLCCHVTVISRSYNDDMGRLSIAPATDWTAADMAVRATGLCCDRVDNQPQLRARRQQSQAGAGVCATLGIEQRWASNN